ncbi:MAG: hypothetical protein FWG22_00905 [Prolixibacteraceae bacterium]|nr:hypothetical protein [Prolixibacteraceae bacterium]
MQIDAKKQIEILLMNYFRQSFSEFPAGKVIPSESPDFIIRCSLRKMTGLELTRLHSPNMLKPSFAVPENSPEMRFIRCVQNLVEEKEPRPLFVKFFFDAPPDEKRMLAQAAKTALAIRQEAACRCDSVFSTLIGKKQLPKMLNSVRIIRNEALTIPIWEKAIGCETGNIIPDIEESLKKKEEKLRIYLRRNLSQYWLLITADRLGDTQHLNIGELLANHPFTFGFDKVFLFELRSARVFSITHS